MWQNYLIIALIALFPVSGALIWFFVFRSGPEYRKILTILISVIDRVEDIGIENIKQEIKGTAETEGLQKRLHKLVKKVTENLDTKTVDKIRDSVKRMLK